MLFNKKQHTGYLLWLAFWVFTALLYPTPTAVLAGKNNIYFETLQKRLIKDGFDESRINELYGRPQVFFEAEGVSRFMVHREATLNYDKFSSPNSIRRARHYIEKHKTTFKGIEESYGVEKEIITAIILVESQFGTFLSGPSILNTLSSLAALSDPNVRDLFWNETIRSMKRSRKKYEKWARRKSKWAYSELKAFLKYTAHENIDPATVTGSYAGAVGIAQFMPSSILAYAKDGNNDGQINLFNHADAITSIASYLQHFGWHAGIDKKSAQKVIYRYNNSTYYVNAILKISELLKG
jgi:membrane-bound lytic murein transglycosylase B